ncbi:hypothetical protein GUJ93_ZPchr0002g25531 [Zizania palustris]|uniref:Uncharacterized protein n=1 Tax=Zizania palustris TaxID=103762 RepID=A0A8J5S835_ZIZPA|nr:hypothetical protein GUJ93_ZPchr0002g25531 [Zizania palustris]
MWPTEVKFPAAHFFFPAPALFFPALGFSPSPLSRHRLRATTPAASAASPASATSARLPDLPPPPRPPAASARLPGLPPPPPPPAAYAASPASCHLRPPPRPPPSRFSPSTPLEGICRLVPRRSRDSTWGPREPRGGGGCGTEGSSDAVVDRKGKKVVDSFSPTPPPWPPLLSDDDADDSIREIEQLMASVAVPPTQTKPKVEEEPDSPKEPQLHRSCILAFKNSIKKKIMQVPESWNQSIDYMSL